ncbi:histidine phosphatase superfamily [Lipomyces arxii]|uniref:histidine phosphatase superfamily n=1 Tax=Lipomyces arxii TaxID=56418 RepID=UPI0034CEF01A
MPLKRVLVARHATRQDSIDPSWQYSSPTPYDPPLSRAGLQEALLLGRSIASEIAATADSYAGHRTDLTRNGLLRDPSPCSRSSDTSLASSYGTDLSFSPSTDSVLLPSLTGSTKSTFEKRLTVCIHTSPFLRCAMTANCITQQLAALATQSTSKDLVSGLTIDLKIRMDTFLGEWLTPDYFSSISPPANDGHASLVASSTAWLLNNGAAKYLDYTWQADRMGHSGEYGERWRSMYARFSSGLSNLVCFYSAPSQPDTVIILVTHGAGHNALVGALSGNPVLLDFGLASLSVAVPRRRDDDTDYHSAYGYGGEKRDRSGYVVQDYSDIVNRSDQELAVKWDLTRIADVSHLLPVSAISEYDIN